MSKTFAGTIAEGMEGEELSRVIVEHWHTGAGALLFPDELVYGCRAVSVSSDRVLDFVRAVNHRRHHEREADVMERAFVPEENREAVCELLDQIQGLCVRM